MLDHVFLTVSDIRARRLFTRLAALGLIDRFHYDLCNALLLEDTICVRDDRHRMRRLELLAPGLDHARSRHALYPGGPKFGLGLWNSVAGRLTVELAMLAIGVGLYASATRARDRIGRYAFVAYIALLLLASYMKDAFSRALPHSVRAEIAWPGLIAGIVLLVRPVGSIGIASPPERTSPRSCSWCLEMPPKPAARRGNALFPLTPRPCMQ